MSEVRARHFLRRRSNGGQRALRSGEVRDISFHPKSITGLRSGVEMVHSRKEVQRSAFAEIFRVVRFSTFATASRPTGA